jgi:hypothetical protein
LQWYGWYKLTLGISLSPLRNNLLIYKNNHSRQKVLKDTPPELKKLQKIPKTRLFLELSKVFDRVLRRVGI